MTEKLTVTQSVELIARLKAGVKTITFENITQIVKGKLITAIVLETDATVTSLGEPIYKSPDMFITFRKGKNPIFDKVPVGFFDFQKKGILFRHVNLREGIEWDKSIIEFPTNIGAVDDGKVVLFQVFYTDLPTKSN